MSERVYSEVLESGVGDLVYCFLVGCSWCTALDGPAACRLRTVTSAVVTLLPGDTKSLFDLTTAFGFVFAAYRNSFM